MGVLDRIDVPNLRTDFDASLDLLKTSTAPIAPH